MAVGQVSMELPLPRPKISEEQSRSTRSQQFVPPLPRPPDNRSQGLRRLRRAEAKARKETVAAREEKQKPTGKQMSRYRRVLKDMRRLQEELELLECEMFDISEAARCIQEAWRESAWRRLVAVRRIQAGVRGWMCRRIPMAVKRIQAGVRGWKWRSVVDEALALLAARQKRREQWEYDHCDGNTRYYGRTGNGAQITILS